MQNPIGQLDKCVDHDFFPPKDNNQNENVNDYF